MKTKKTTFKSKSKKLMVSKSDYENDFYKWTQTQASLLRKGNFGKLDLENILEEFKDLGGSVKSKLFSFLKVLLQHLLKNTFAIEGKGNSTSWDATIINCQNSISKILKENPSLKNYLLTIIDEAYEQARETAIVETQKSYIFEEDFPEDCPWTIDELFPYLKKKNKQKS